MNTANAQLQQKIFSKQAKRPETGKTPRNVWQDKSGRVSDRSYSPQPASVNGGARSPGSNTKLPRSQKSPGRDRKAVPLQLWVDPIDKAEVQRQAELSGLSVSAVGAALLAEILRQKLHIQQAATIETVIEHAIAKAHRKLANRLAFLMVRIAIDTGESRVLDSNILGMMVEMNEARLKDVLATAKKRARANLTRETPQLTELVEKVKQWLLEGEEGAKTNGSR